MLLRKFTWILILEMILLLAINIYAIEFSNDYMLYVYGSRSCPHCHTLANYLIDRGMTFTWFWIEDQDNLDNFKALARDLDISQGTPTVIVYVNGRPSAIVLGAITDDNFWRNIIDNPGSSLKIFYGDTLIKEIPIPKNFTEKYISATPASYEDVRSYAKGVEARNLLEFLPTFILLAILVGAALFIYLRKS